MRSINIGIVEIEQMERNTKRILAIIQKNNILKNIPHTLTLLRRSKLTADFMFYKYNLDNSLLKGNGYKYFYSQFKNQHFALWFSPTYIPTISYHRSCQSLLQCKQSFRVFFDLIKPPNCYNHLASVWRFTQFWGYSLKTCDD